MVQAQEKQKRKRKLGSISATLYTLFLPLNYNDGRRIHPALLECVQDEILHYAGGLTTFLPGRGYWIDHSARVSRDLVMPVQAVVSAGSDAESWFARLSAKMSVILEQQEIFIFAQQVWLFERESTHRLVAREGISLTSSSSVGF